MGSGRHLVVSATGFPGTTETWRFIQTAWREPLSALALMTGDKTVITGCVVVGGVMGDGFISYNGEILPFRQSNVGATITMVREVINADYDVDVDNDGQQDSLPVFEIRYLRFGSDGVASFPYAELKRLKTIQELSDYTLPDYLKPPQYVAFTLTLLNKLNGIEASAQKNVQSDWNVENPASDAFIKNRPTGLMRYLHKASYYAGPVSGQQLITINFPNVGTANYVPFISLEGSQYSGTATIVYETHSYTASSFKIQLRETTPGLRTIMIHYFLLPN